MDKDSLHWCQDRGSFVTISVCNVCDQQLLQTLPWKEALLTLATGVIKALVLSVAKLPPPLMLSDPTPTAIPAIPSWPAEMVR
jgi:hypothetical protein